MPSQPSPHEALLKSLAAFKGREVTLLLSSGSGFTCTFLAVVGGIVYFETELTGGCVLASSVIGYEAANT